MSVESKRFRFLFLTVSNTDHLFLIMSGNHVSSEHVPILWAPTSHISLMTWCSRGCSDTETPGSLKLLPCGVCVEACCVGGEKWEVRIALMDSGQRWIALNFFWWLYLIKNINFSSKGMWVEKSVVEAFICPIQCPNIPFTLSIVLYS